MAPREQKPDLASAMWPHLSRDVKVREVEQTKAQVEMRERLKRMAENLQEVTDAWRKEQGR
jgi:hypothetical protein